MLYLCRLRTWLAGLLLALATPAQAEAPLPVAVEVGEDRLSLIRQDTIRYAGLFRVYSLGVYAPAPQPLPQLLAADASTCIEARYHRDLEREILIEAAHHILERQHPTPRLQAFSDGLARLHAAYVDIRAGDRYRLCRLRDSGLTLDHNGRQVLFQPDPELARLYLGIWLGPGGILDDNG
ncbi:hypothetical protein TspCOW1_09290 [Thiohalobacter sp. COW1]|nr:hypothetical protein TspCOW1_09290 [Thiohalobacter sp. COW1]